MFDMGSRMQILKNMYRDFATNWMYSATIQLTLNGSEPAWSLDGWSFLPIDLSKISNSSIHHKGNQTAAEMSSVSTTTSALRGRLECSPYENLDNVSTWLTTYDLSNSSAWNASTFPVDWTIGYELGVNGNATTPDDPVYNMFNDTYLLWDASRVSCCTNGTNDAERASAFGYWTPYYPDDISLDLKLNPNSYPMNFTTKWIYGHAASGFQKNGSETERFIFREVPSAQALHCAPIIETASANVVVNEQTGEVQSYSILDEPKSSDDAWRDVYLMHQAASGGAHDILSVTVTYGVLFLDALLGASIHNNMFRLNGNRADNVDEALSDVTFNFRDTDQGLDLDLMTYSMYSMVDKDPKALLNATIMADLANKTFSTFFQHFVSTNRSETGSWTYQRINDTLPDNLGQILDDDGSVSANQTVSYPVSQSNHTADVLVSTPVEMLRMGRVAVWLSVVVLIWLIVTVVFITVVHRNQLKRLNRNVECAADVLVLVAGSEKLLQLVRENGIEAVAKGDDRFVAKLGWFEGGDGEVRWGVEVFERDQEND
ncbi:hypothetical protein DIS24_g12137 [Lasiodiplodia hormozganensis]|uniref:Uncharacterized protein n=1 Tax=Lasiodiplodia hormozganensis TaxID=869390 RepID=A0AA39W403_9PEZI|nr:hypothetical protein DIS24_g12137 [Lasiodiplodia hormozganensis]